MFGIPLVGADVWGYHEAFEQEMWARWMQLSVFYPFARNNYNYTNMGNELLPEQEPYNLKNKYLITARNAINQRYSFLMFFYTRLFEIHKFGGGTLVRPLFFEFPDDSKVYSNYESSFMVGKELKVTPVLTSERINRGYVNSYFPANSRFISLNDFKTIVESSSSGKNMSLETSWNSTIVHLREGSIIPIQNLTETPVMRTYNLIKDVGINIVVFPDKNGNAEGSIYLDANGDDQMSFEVNHYEFYKIRYSNKTLTIDLQDGKGSEGNIDTGNHVIRNVYILGVGKMENVTTAGCIFDNNLNTRDILVFYDSARQLIKLTINQGVQMLIHEIKAIQYTTSGKETWFCKSNYKVSNKITSGNLSKLIFIVNAANNKSKVQIELTNENGLPPIKATFVLIKDNLIRIMIESNNTKGFKVTDDVFNPEMLPLNEYWQARPDQWSQDIESILYVPKEGEIFFYEIHEKNNPSKVLYSTKGQQLVFTQNYIKTTSIINSNGKIFGLGERVGEFFLSEGVYTLWNRDEPSPIENGRRPGNNIYGTHPIYYTQMKTSNQFFAVFDNNAGAQDFIIQSDPQGMKITHIKTSGVTDLFILMNDDIKNVVSEFINLIGRPLMVPEWSLGWHHWRYGYNNSDQVNEVVNKYLEYSIPLDAIWTDIDYMDMYKDFTISKQYFGKLPNLVDGWRSLHGIHYIPIIDAAIAYEENSKNSTYSRGKDKNIFIKDPNNPKTPFIGKVWPGPAVYVDWANNISESFWIDEMKRLNSIINFDGMWIDMNEASNFCDGYWFKTQKVIKSIKNSLFYIPGSRDLNVKSISIDAKHADGSLELEAHSLYGFYMSKATSNYFNNTKNQRPFVITRSSYSGFGKFASHWLGDNFSTFDMLKYSVGGIYLFNMFGVPITGADICGFISDTHPELWARWYAMGAFYPFARNHNDKNSISQEPYVDMFSKNIIPGTRNVTYTDFIREASLRRYSIHRYHYSYIHKASTEGIIYFKPLFYNYPDDSNAFNQVEQNIMLGDSIKFSPIVNQGTSSTFYFPEKGAIWCPIWPKYQMKCFPGQSFQQVTVMQDEMLLHLKSGSIIPLQLSNLSPIKININLMTLKEFPIDLGILADNLYKASGWIRFDNGTTKDLKKYSEFTLNAIGASPFIGKSYLNIYITITKDESDDKGSSHQSLQTLIIYNSSQFKFTNSSIANINLKDKSTIAFPSIWNKEENICRFKAPNEGMISLREINDIHISS